LADYLITVFGSRFRAGIEDPQEITSAPEAGGEASANAHLLEVEQRIPSAVVKRFRVDSNGKINLTQEFLVPDPFAATHADLLNRCLDDFMDLLYEIFKTSRVLMYCLYIPHSAFPFLT